MRGGWVKHKLTATKVKQSLPRHRAYKLADGNGLYLLIKTNGTKCWRYNYRFDQKEKTLALDVYPTVSLAAVRE